MNKIRSFLPHVMALFIAGVFIDSLRFKFTNHPNTQVIFGKLEAWASSLGFPETFVYPGIFNQYVIGSFELIAATLLILGIIPALRKLQGVGALIALAIMTGAVSFHLFTPLGTDPNNDGGGLFVAACIVWLLSAIVVYLRFRKS